MKINVTRENNINKKKYLFFLILIIIGIVCCFFYTNINIKKNEEIVEDKSELVGDVVGLSESEQKKITRSNMKNMEENLTNGINYIVIESLDVAVPIFSFSSKLNEEKINEVLKKGAMTYNMYGSPAQGNYILFGHNSGQYPRGYFTPLINGLKINDEVWIRTSSQSYRYKITNREIINDDGVEKVFFKSQKPIITIGTCDVPSEKTKKRIIFSGELINENE